MTDSQTQNFNPGWTPAKQDKNMAIAKWLSLAACILLLVTLLKDLFMIGSLMLNYDSTYRRNADYPMTVSGFFIKMILIWFAIHQFRVISGMQAEKRTDSNLLIVLAGVTGYLLLNKSILTMILHLAFFNVSGILTLAEFGICITVLVLYWKERDGKLLPIFVLGLAVYRLIIVHILSAIDQTKYMRYATGSEKSQAFFQSLNPFYVNPMTRRYTPSVEIAVNVASRVAGFLAFGLFWLAIFFVLRANAGLMLKESDSAEKKANQSSAGLFLTLATLFAVGIVGVNWIMSLDSGSGGGRGRVGGTCTFDGCNRPAVGPTYEFCEFHKKALDNYWKYSGAYD